MSPAPEGVVLPELGSALLRGGASVLALMFVLWLVSLRRRDVSIVDAFWGPAFLLLSAAAAVGSDGVPERRGLVLSLVALWGLRLGLHIARRARGQGEDRRYAAMRAEHGDRFARRSLVTVFMLQGALVVVIGLPVVVALTADAPPLGPVDLLAAGVFAVGFAFEAIGDRQLARFKADPANRGRVMDRGLWRYTRHPNYFGDATLWWGLAGFAFATGAWWCLPCPAIMSFLLRRVSGVPLLEKDLRQRRPEYADYVRRTPAFFPGRPRPAR
jgi:steroid 5-alpha reductase family enzyme